VLDIRIAYPSATPEWPANVKVYQYADRLVGRTDLGLYPLDKALSKTGKGIREGYYKRIVDEIKGLPDFDIEWEIGLITFKGIEGNLDLVGEATQFLERAGLDVAKPKKPLYYFSLRGSNELEHVKILVLLGCPIPAPHDFMEEANAFFHGGLTTLKGKWGKVEDRLKMRNGVVVPVKTGGYVEDERLQKYFRQKCQAELYQAVHRIRPYLYQMPYQSSPLSSEGVNGIKDPLPASNPLDHFGVSGHLLEYGLNGSPFGGQGLIHFSFHLVAQELEDAFSRIEFR